MKITIKLAKLRNPLVLMAKQRHGGAHGSYRPERHERRTENQRLRQLLRERGLPCNGKGDSDE